MKLVDADKARECFGGDGVTGAVMQRMFDTILSISPTSPLLTDFLPRASMEMNWSDRASSLKYSLGM